MKNKLTLTHKKMFPFPHKVGFCFFILILKMNKTYFYVSNEQE